MAIQLESTTPSMRKRSPRIQSRENGPLVMTLQCASLAAVRWFKAVLLAELTTMR